MPRVSVAHEQAVRARIVDSALRVFAEKGYHGATIGDVVRDSGLSVGAIYTYFRGKDELFLATCEFSAAEGLGELGNRLVRGRTVAEKLAIAVGFFLDAMAGVPGEPDMAGMLVMQWARADGEPSIRASLSRRRDQIATAGELLIREGISHAASCPPGRMPRRSRPPTSRSSTGCCCGASSRGPPTGARRPSDARSHCCARSSPRPPRQRRRSSRTCRAESWSITERRLRSPACRRRLERAQRFGDDRDGELVMGDLVARARE